MKRNAFMFLLFMLLGGWLAACGGGDEIDPASFQEAASETLGITIGYPEDWVSQSEGADLQLATSQQLFDDPENVDEGALFIITGFEQELARMMADSEIEADDAVALLDVFGTLLMEDDETVTVREASRAVQYNGRDAAVMTMEAENEQGETLYALLAAVPNEEVVIYIFAVTPAAQEETFQPLFEAMLNTIELSAPNLAAGADEEVAAAAEAAVETGPEPTLEPEPTAVPEPTATPEPEPTADPTAGFVAVSGEMLGVALRHPAGWVSRVNESSGDLEIASSEALLDNPETLEEGILVQVTSLPADLLAFLGEGETDVADPVAVLEIFTQLIAETEGEDETSFVVREAAAPATIAGYEAATAVYDVSSEELTGLVKFVAISDPDNDRAVLLFAGIPPASEADYLPLLDAMLGTVALSPPTGGDLLGSGGGDGGDDVVAGEPISQFAQTAVASSEYTPSDWSAAQATGQPDTAECGDRVTAWASSASDGTDWLEVTFAVPVYADSLLIYQTYNPDQVSLVELLTPEGEYVPVYEGTPSAAGDSCPYTLPIPLDGDILAAGARITVDQSQLGIGWNEIDAVEIVGVPAAESGGGAVSGSSRVGMVGGGTAVVADDVPRNPPAAGMAMFSNGNEVFDIALHGDLLYAATGGGLVAWDYAAGEPVAKWTTLDGLGHNVAQAVTVCPLPQERIVVGTRAGLSLYDPAGNTFENWSSENSGMSSDAGVYTLTCVPQMNALVIGYDLDGVEVYEANSDRWTYYEPFDDLESGFAEALAVKGNLEEIWVAHIGSVSRISHQTGAVTYYDDETGLDDLDTDDFEHFVEDIVVDNSGTVWFAQGGGLTRVDGDGAFTFFASDTISGWPFWSGTDDLTLGPDGTIWTNATLGGICQFDPASATCLTSFEDEAGMGDSFNNGITVDAAGQIFYGSEGDGVSYYDGAAWHHLQLEEKVLTNQFDAIAQGADGSIWIGGFDGGQKFFAYDVDGAWEDLGDHLTWEAISTFYPEAEGMWVGHSGGASFYNYETGAWTDLESAETPGEGINEGEVTAIARDSQGRLWFGTTGGVTVWDGETFTYLDLLTDTERSDERSPRWVYDILAEGDHVWVGGVSVLYRFDATDGSLPFTRWDEANGLPGFFPSVYALGLEQDGTVLVAVDGNLLRHDGADGFDEIYDAGFDIRMIAVDGEGVLALATDGGGLHLLLEGEWMTLTTADGLPANELDGENILIDYQETLWIAAGEGGLLQIAP